MTPSHQDRLEQLQALSDEELIERVAVEVMGWEKKWNYDNPIPVGFWWPRAVQMRFWNPLTDWNHAAEVVRTMRSRWWMSYLIRSQANGKTLVEFTDKVGMLAGRHIDKDECRAVCLASLLAVQP